MAIGLGAALLGSAVVGGIASSSAAKKNSKTIAASTDATLQSNRETLAQQRQIHDEDAARLGTYDNLGRPAGATINALLGLGGDTAAANNAFDAYRNSSGYDFRLQQGQNALNNGYASRGVFNSGAAQKAAIQYGQDYGSGEFGNYLGYLGNQQGVGLSAASAIAGVGQGFSNSLSTANAVNANALANGANAKVANTNSLYSGLASSFGTGLGALSSFGGAGNQKIF